MALHKTTATIVAVKRETIYREVLTFVDADAVMFDSINLQPNTDMLERSTVNATTLLKGSSIQGAKTSTGDITIETIPDAVDTTKFAGHVLYESLLGSYVANGATITATDVTDNTTAADGTAGVYTLSDGTAEIKTMGIKFIQGGIEAESMDIRGITATSLKLSFPSQGIITSNFSLEGATGFIPVTQAVPPGQSASINAACSSKLPYVAKSMTLEVGGVSVCATDLELNITTDISQIKCIKDDGVSAISNVGRKIEGSFTVIFDNLDDINAYNAATTTSLFVRAVNAEGNEFAIKLNNIKRTNFSFADDNSVIVQNVTFEAFSECNSAIQPIYIAVK